MADDDPTPARTGSWWSTLPGMLTATAGFLTALTALIVTVSGLFGGGGAPGASPADAGTQPTAVETTPTEPRLTEPLTPYEVRLPGGARVTAGNMVYDLRRATAEPRNPDEVTLGLTIRATNNGIAADNFWSSTFRLRVGDAKRAPVNGLNEVVEADSSLDGLVEFVVPATPGTHTLTVSHAGDEVELPVELRRR